ncbi:3289_t:CDS:2, partial [Funneliformis caledonium]
VYLKPLYTPQSLQLELQLRTLKNLLESVSEDKPEPLETLLTDLESAWNSYLEFDCWEFETSIKSGINSKSNSKGTSKRTSQKSSNALKMNKDTFHIGTSISGRRISENQADPHREWAAILNNIFSDCTFK